MINDSSSQWGNMINKLFDLSGKLAFVTGKMGLLAPIWKETFEGANCEVISYGLPEDDIMDKVKLTKVATQYVPDIIVNNAAIDNPPNSKSTFFGNYENIVSVNLLGAVNVCDAFIPGMISNGGGVIINIGSIQGVIGADWRSYPDPEFEKPIGYNISKAGLIQLSRSITTQYGRYNIRCVTIGFGAYGGGKLDYEFLARYTNNVPLRRCVNKEDLQRTLLFACTCESFAGQMVLVDGGYTAW